MANHTHDVSVTKFDARDYSVECHQCGGVFEAKRSDAAFCSPRCRVAFSREPQKFQNALEELAGYGRAARRIADKYNNRPAAFEALLELQKQVAIALAQFEQD